MFTRVRGATIAAVAAVGLVSSLAAVAATPASAAVHTTPRAGALASANDTSGYVGPFDT